MYTCSGFIPPSLYNVANLTAMNIINLSGMYMYIHTDRIWHTLYNNFYMLMGYVSLEYVTMVTITKTKFFFGPRGSRRGYI